MDCFKKIVFFLFVLLALVAGDAMAYCNGKKIVIQLPSGWSSTVIVYWDGGFYSFPAASQGGGWYEFSLSGLTNDNDNKKGITFFKTSNGHNDPKIGATNWGTTSGVDNEKIICSAYSSERIYVSESLTQPGKTVVAETPPNAKFFYFLPPNEDEWITGTPYIKIGDANPVRMQVDDRCGWYRMIYTDGNAPDGDALIFLGPSGTDKIGILGVDEENPAQPTPFNLKTQFDKYSSSYLYFIAQDGWRATEPGAEWLTQTDRCNYNFAAIIYYKGSTGNSFSHYADQSGDAEGVCKGYVQPTLVDGKMKWAGRPSCGSYGWANQADFENAFKKTNANQELCYDMPFNKRSSGLWEFDALYLCRDGTVDYSGNCYSGRVGGFYIPDQVFINANAVKGRMYNGDFGVGPQSCFNKWCYDRGWIGGSCSGMSGGISSMAEGNLDGLTTGPLITAEMAKYCRRPVAQGDFAGYGSWLGTEPGGSAPTGVTGLLCFESAPATFTYEPGQEFFFRGDDDIWVFINNRLVVDLGGNHGPAPGYVKLDTLGLTPGGEYPINIFFCDRRGPGSNVRITTNMYFAQKNGLYKIGDGLSKPAEICMVKSGGGSCAAVKSGNTGEGDKCGGDLKNDITSGNLVFNLVNKKQTDSIKVALLNPDICTAESPGVYRCYGGIIIDANKGTARVEETKIVSLTGSWTLYVQVHDLFPDPKPPRVKIASFGAKVNVQMAWGNIKNDAGVSVFNLCKKSGTVVMGELNPVCFAVGTQVDDNNFVIEDDGIGNMFSLNRGATCSAAGTAISPKCKGLLNEFEQLGVKIFLDSLGNQPVDNLNQSFAIPSNGVLVLWVTGTYDQRTSPWMYTVNVTGASTPSAEFTSIFPTLNWVKAPGSTDLPCKEPGFTTTYGYGSKLATPEENFSTSKEIGCPNRDGGKLDFAWMGESVNLTLRVLRADPTKGTCKTCGKFELFPLTLTGKALGGPSVATADVPIQTDLELISYPTAPNFKVVDGEANFNITGKQPVWDKTGNRQIWAEINVMGQNDITSSVKWDSLMFQKPPVPIPENVQIFDDNGDGIGDRIRITYNRGFHKDSLPNRLQVFWDPDTSIELGYGKLEGGKFTNIGIDKPANFTYWKQYLIPDAASTSIEGRETQFGADYAVKIEALRDIIELKGKFSIGVRTAGAGTLKSWSSFKAQQTSTTESHISHIGFESSIEEKIPAIVVSADYVAGEGYGCGGSKGTACSDKLTIRFSEPVMKDITVAADLAIDKIKNPFAYKLIDIDGDKAEFKILDPAYLPKVTYGLNAQDQPSSQGDSVVVLRFDRWRSSDVTNNSWTPMPLDSVKFASKEVSGHGFAPNILTDLKGNEPNKMEIGREIVGRKPFTPEKVAIGEVDPNNPNYATDNAKNVITENGGTPPGDLFSNSRPVEMLPVPPNWTAKDAQDKYGGTVGVLFNPDIASELQQLEEQLYGKNSTQKIPDSEIVISAKAFYHTNLGNYVADKAVSLKCNDPIFPNGSCRNSRSKIYIAWDMKDFKGRFVGTGAYVGLYDFYWQVNPAYTTGSKNKFATVERQVEMHGVKRTKRK